jgi:hypothetical protein
MKLIVWLEEKCYCKIKGKHNQQHGTWSHWKINASELTEVNKTDDMQMRVQKHHCTQEEHQVVEAGVRKGFGALLLFGPPRSAPGRRCHAGGDQVECRRQPE